MSIPVILDTKKSHITLGKVSVDETVLAQCSKGVLWVDQDN
jgi:hypothetical protein